jgi:hypothetical protein
MKRFLLPIILTLSAEAQAGSILYYNDLVVGTDQMAQALADLSGTHTTETALSSSDFASKLASGNYDLGILFIQNFFASSYSDAISALGSFVSAGGASIFTDWSRDDSAASLFGASYGGQINYSAFTISDPTLQNGVGSFVELSNPGWGTYSMGISSPNNLKATFSDGFGAISLVGRSIVNGFLSDTFVNEAQGVALYTNEINMLLGNTPSAVPVPAAVWLFGTGLAGLMGFNRKRTQSLAS